MTLGKIAEFTAIGITLILAITLAILYLPKQQEVVYNCSIAEISPDIPLKVKEECRKINMREIK